MLDNGIELIEGQPIAFVKELSALVVADLHLGYEAITAKRGALLPQVNLRGITESLAEAIEKRKPKQIIVDGDIKNEFSKVEEAEFNELYDFINFAKDKKVKLVLIKGNHDNFVERYKEPFNLSIYRQEARMKDCLFFHGEEPPNALNDANVLIMGHEHPSLTVYNSVGRQERLKCFLYGKYKKRNLLVMPAMNYFTFGTPVNIEPKCNLLSPIFKHVDIDRMHALAIGYGSTLDFGTVGQLRRISRAR